MVDMNKVKAFHAAHAVGGPSVQWEGFIYYSDGSYRDVDPIGVLAEPDSDDFVRLSNIATYHRARLQKTVAAFQDLKDSLLTSSPQPEELNRLQGLRTEIVKRRKDVHKAEADLALTETARARAGHQEFLAEERQRQASWREQVKSVQLG